MTLFLFQYPHKDISYYIMLFHNYFLQVQISNDNGQTWRSLENEYTSYIIDEGGYPTIRDNLPGLDGVSDGWESMSFNISEYGGQTIQLALRYMTDWAFEEPGWWVDNIAINGVMVDNGDDILWVDNDNIQSIGRCSK